MYSFSLNDTTMKSTLLVATTLLYHSSSRLVAACLRIFLPPRSLAYDTRKRQYYARCSQWFTQKFRDWAIVGQRWRRHPGNSTKNAAYDHEK
jgi:hypothetical protein